MRPNVGTRRIVQAWGRILAGYRPNISIEITRECPLRCPGCYAYEDGQSGTTTKYVGTLTSSQM